MKNRFKTSVCITFTLFVVLACVFFVKNTIGNQVSIKQDKKIPFEGNVSAPGGGISFTSIRDFEDPQANTSGNVPPALPRHTSR